MNKNKRGKIYYSMQALCIIPLLLYAALIIIFSAYSFTKTMHKEVANGLADASSLCIEIFDATYPGDYLLKENIIGTQTAYSIYKGDTDITNRYSLVDRLKEVTEMEVTLFYKDTRILTTLTNWENQRIIGTGAPDNVITDVLLQKEPHFYDNVIINGETYFAYYAPLHNSDGSVVGMLFVGKPAAEVASMINTSLYPIIAVGCFAMLIVAVISLIYAKNILNALHKLKEFLGMISTNDLNAQLDLSVIEREDELSEIGRAALSMQSSLRNLIELDTLTELYNRRSGNKKLHTAYTNAKEKHTPLSVVIADIDHFKGINDTYGHHNGDVVLRNVAKLLKKHTQGKGYAIRWGGEEFLLLFENCDIPKTLEILTALQEDLHQTVHQLDESEIYVTMTFGVTCNAAMDTAQLLRSADEKLYCGKNNGRNCIIS